MKVLGIHVLLISVLSIGSYIAEIYADDANAEEELGKSTAEIVRLRKFIAEDHYVPTGPRHVINLVRIRNPEVNNGAGKLPNKKSIVFVHGIFVGVTYFIGNSVDVRPKDMSKIDAANMSIEELTSLLANEPVTKCLPFLFSNFGNDVWLMNRRSTLESQRASGQSIFRANKTATSSPTNLETKIFGTQYDTVESLIRAVSNSIQYNFITGLNPYIQSENYNPLYWDFSIDEQAMIDLPNVIDYIRAHDNRSQVSLVSHSLGGALTLMMMGSKPEYQDKVGRSVLFAPSLDLGGHQGELFFKLALILEPFLVTYVGPVPPDLLTTILQSAGATLCPFNILDSVICRPLMDFLLGDGGDQLVLQGGMFQGVLEPGSSHEFLQLAQSYRRGIMRKLDYLVPTINYYYYNSLFAPYYNVSKNVQAYKFDIWVGNTDTLVNPEDTRILLELLSTPHQVHFLDGPGLKFNHLSYQYHRNVSTIVNIPALQSIESG